VKWAGSESDHSPPSHNKVKNGWSYISNPPYVFMPYRETSPLLMSSGITMLSSYLELNYIGHSESKDTNAIKFSLDIYYTNQVKKNL
jgi:hypothetical protein